MPNTKGTENLRAKVIAKLEQLPERKLKAISVLIQSIVERNEIIATLDERLDTQAGQIEWLKDQLKQAAAKPQILNLLPETTIEHSKKKST